MLAIPQLLQSGRVVLMDGAMGTELQRPGPCDDICTESLNLTRPERVRTIHRAYVDAGATILLTNTFQANAAALSRCGLADRLDDIWNSAIRIARDAAKTDALVLADVGPIEGELSADECRLLAEACSRADGVMFETLTELDGAPTALASALHRLRPEIPVFVSFTFLKQPDGQITGRFGRTAEECARLASQFGASAVGTNCGRDIAMPEVHAILRDYRRQLGESTPIFARPNAGSPTRTDQGWLYPQTPASMATRLEEILAAGVDMIGGCCGTTPEYIAAFKPVIDKWNNR